MFTRLNCIIILFLIYCHCSFISAENIFHYKANIYQYTITDTNILENIFRGTNDEIIDKYKKYSINILVDTTIEIKEFATDTFSISWQIFYGQTIVPNTMDIHDPNFYFNSLNFHTKKLKYLVVNNNGIKYFFLNQDNKIENIPIENFFGFQTIPLYKKTLVEKNILGRERNLVGEYFSVLNTDSSCLLEHAFYNNKNLITNFILVQYFKKNKKGFFKHVYFE